MVNPWADSDTAAEASIDLPVTWTVQRHEPSAEYPGLHVTVLDQDSLPVANLYFGPLADAVRSEGPTISIVISLFVAGLP